MEWGEYLQICGYQRLSDTILDLENPAVLIKELTYMQQHPKKLVNIKIHFVNTYTWAILNN